MPIPFIGEGGRIVKKVLFLMLCLIMLMAVPMTVCATTEDPSPEATTSKKKPKKPKKSPKTADNGMVEAAIILLAVSSGVIFISRKYLQESM